MRRHVQLQCSRATTTAATTTTRATLSAFTAASSCAWFPHSRNPDEWVLPRHEHERTPVLRQQPVSFGPASPLVGVMQVQQGPILF